MVRMAWQCSTASSRHSIVQVWWIDRAGICVYTVLYVCAVYGTVLEPHSQPLPAGFAFVNESVTKIGRHFVRAYSNAQWYRLAVCLCVCGCCAPRRKIVSSSAARHELSMSAHTCKCRCFVPSIIKHNRDSFRSSTHDHHW